MVISRLSGDVSYPEMSRLEAADDGRESSAYELDLMGQTVIIALGTADFTFRKSKIVFYPVYLIHAVTHSTVCKIGIVEFRAGDVSYLDDTGEVKLEAQPFAPLIFASVNEALLKKSHVPFIAVVKENAKAAAKGERASSKGKKTGRVTIDTPSSIDKAASDTAHLTPADAPPIVTTTAAPARLESLDDSGDSGDAGDAGEESDGDIKDAPLPTQTKELSNVEKRQYETASKALGGGGRKKRAPELWIQAFMHNKYFGIEDNEGGNDSIFATVRDGLRSQGRVVTIDEMRTALSEMATKELYDDYIRHFNTYAHPLKRALTELAEQDTRLAAITDRKVNSQGTRIPVTELLKIESELKRAIAQRESVKRTVKHLQDTVRTRYGYMKDTRGELDKFKTVLKTRSFIPDAWTLRVLEKMYNVKIIRLSSSRFESGDLDNVVMCGDEISDSPGLGLAEFKAVHKPIFFIMASVDERGNYSLIKYRAKGSFSFAELPYDVRIQITTKCLETGGGEYEHIPQFKRLMESSPEYVTRQRRSNGSGGGNRRIIDPDNDAGDAGSAGSNATSGLPVLQFYNRASNEFPGKGPGEYVPASEEHLFIPLAAIPEWRRALTNFAESPFVLDGRSWFSVEHYYQGSKFKKQNHNFYTQFSLDSGSDISKDPALAKAAGSMSGMVKGVQYRPSAIKMDADYLSSGQGPKSVLDAMDAKFSQNAEMKRILLATRNAQLYHFQRGEPRVLFSNLMQVRAKLGKS